MNSEIIELKKQVEELQKQVIQLNIVNEAILDIIKDINDALNANIDKWKFQNTLNKAQNIINSRTCAEFKILKEQINKNK